ncbi:MAG TPA: type II secretion system minor pseudopilin GspK [Xanthomonadaceae bacterium]|nr:type II secretion system minor pseudopilin GspK [Xanthomonadaceae bacterium]
MTRASARGAALLLVLWLVALLTALVGAFALSARVEHLQGQVLSRGVAAAEAARAGVEYAVVRVGSDDQRWRWLPDGRPYRWDFGNARVEVRIVDEQGKVDLNLASADLLAALFRGAGAEQAQAARLAAAVLDWRDGDDLAQPGGGAEDRDYAAAGLPYGAKDEPFESVAELQQVLGMPKPLYARVEPFLTVYSGRALPDPAFAQSAVLAAMGYDAQAVLAQRRAWNPASGQPGPTLSDGSSLVGYNSGTYSIESRARLRTGRSAVLRATLRVGGNGVPGSAWTPLRWEEGASPR